MDRKINPVRAPMMLAIIIVTRSLDKTKSYYSWRQYATQRWHTNKSDEYLSFKYDSERFFE